MKLARLVTASVLAANVAAVGLAGQAAATDDITMNAVGVYDLLFKNQTKASAFWVVSPCENDADQCIQVKEFAASDLAQKKPHWTKNAYWGVGSWVMEPIDSQRSCKDSSKYGVTYSYSWDAATNTGYRSYFEPGVCDDNQSRNVAAPFSLIRVGPPSA
ncbi:hypothetical protein EV580_5839 [Mycobacterium sp. BK086]|uniref:hypothetical protein n=1 Tax=Mycobacterium sp. BK086 TaxID=2512165 RepID=UPI00105F68E7|nr:hypothetical protein [Mycobacterium sp. BK086]TDO08267.1 hypothetical protein EV580_5839 [Mycobacterium sp. BK086]